MEVIMRHTLSLAFSFTAVTLCGCIEEKKVETVSTVKAVEYDVQKTNPPVLTVKATGEVKSLGYTDAKLTRTVHKEQPPHGIQDYTLTAVPPSGVAGQAISEITAEDRWENFEKDAPWLKGVRIKGIAAGEKLVWIKADAVVKHGEATGKAKVGQIVEIQIQYPVVPPFPSDFEVQIDGKTIPHSESTGAVLVGGQPVVGVNLNCIRFPVKTGGKQAVTVKYKRGNDTLTTDVKLDVSK
jgi:hypothetical protein